MKLNNNGFISMTSVLAIIVSVSVVLILNIDIKMQNNNLLNKIKTDSRENIKKISEPICQWSPEVNMVKTSSKPEAFNAITLTCKHVDGLVFNSNDINHINNIDNINNYFTKSNDNFVIDSILAYDNPGGFKIILGLKSSTVDEYYITLKENIFCLKNTSDVCNKEIKSNPIHVVNGS